MNKKSLIKKTEVFVKSHLGKEGTGHDWSHVERVRNNAIAICRNEKADKFIVELAALLHDVGDRKVIKKPEDDYSIAENFLNKNKVSEEIRNKVMFILKNISFSKTLNNKIKNAPLELYVVQDADRLDAIGAIGIARAFTFGGSRARPIHDPSKKIGIISNKEKYKKPSTSTFHHFHEKLLLLKDLMNTRTGQKMAIKRHRHMEDFVDQFLLEWEGKA